LRLLIPRASTTKPMVSRACSVSTLEKPINNKP
jgi:hypothetical protein